MNTINSFILIVHIAGGLLSILSGMIALFSRKGSRLHLKTGNVFYVSMLTMGTSAVYLAVFGKELTSIMAGLTAIYFVFTAKRTAANRKGKSGLPEIIAACFASGMVVIGVVFSNYLIALKAETNTALTAIDYFLFFYTATAALGAILDFVVITKGGIYGARRIARHVWRMCYALWIATTSLFLGQPQVFPEFMNDTLLRSIPVIVVVFMWFFWLIRVLVIRRFKSVSVRA